MIIALGHKKFTGKDSTARIIADHFKEYSPKLISFAYPLKKLTYDLYSWAGVQKPEYYETLPSEKTKMLPALGMTVRDLWIKVGIYFRDIHPDTWAYPAIQLAKKERLAILTDCRFPNEFRLLREAKALLIRIDRPQVKPTDDAADCALDGEKGWDMVFVNSTVTLKGLEKKVRKDLMPLIAKGL